MDAGFYEVPLELDGVNRTMRIDFNVLCDAEKVSGINYLMDWDRQISGNGLRALCWAAWRRTDPKLAAMPTDKALEQVGLILGRHAATVMAAMTEAWLRAMPEPEEADRAQDPTRPTQLPQ